MPQSNCGIKEAVLALKSQRKEEERILERMTMSPLASVSPKRTRLEPMMEFGEPEREHDSQQCTEPANLPVAPRHRLSRNDVMAYRRMGVAFVCKSKDLDMSLEEFKIHMALREGKVDLDSDDEAEKDAIGSWPATTNHRKMKSLRGKPNPTDVELTMRTPPVSFEDSRSASSGSSDSLW